MKDTLAIRDTLIIPLFDSVDTDRKIKRMNPCTFDSRFPYKSKREMTVRKDITYIRTVYLSFEIG